MSLAIPSEIADWPVVAAGRIPLLDVDPELNGDAPNGDGTAPQLSVPAYRLPRGPLPQLAPPASRDHLGFLLLKGLVLREVVVCGRPTAELLGPGDLIQPWPREVVELLPRTVTWNVLEKAIIADLGGSFVARVSGLPDVLQSLIERSVARAESLALSRSIASHVRVDVRVLAFLWHLAERWGVVLPTGVRIDVPLTHAVMARMVGARRPTVTTALQRLMHMGYLRRVGSLFVLLGEPSAVAELESRSPSRDFALPAGPSSDGRTPSPAGV